MQSTPSSSVTIRKELTAALCYYRDGVVKGVKWLVEQLREASSA